MKVTVFEVGPRDGLQNEKTQVGLNDRVEFVRGLVAAGLQQIELGAFVRTDRVPQMAQSAELQARVAAQRDRESQARFWNLVPNRKGLENALAAGARDLALFTAASEGFARANIGMSITESLAEFRAVVKDAKAISRASGKPVRFRGYVSTAFGCPFDGAVSARQTFKVVDALLDLGVEQVSIGDTIGVANPKQVDAIIRPLLRRVPTRKVALHLHDTRGTALANALRGLELGVRTLDASAGGLGGCPFAPGATGNLATEDLVYMLNGMGVHTGVDLPKLCEASLRLAAVMGRPLTSRYLSAHVHAQTRS